MEELIICGFADQFLFGNRLSRDEFIRYLMEMKSYPNMTMEFDHWMELKKKYERKFHES